MNPAAKAHAMVDIPTVLLEGGFSLLIFAADNRRKRASFTLSSGVI
ncbi:hypothetical protein [Nitrosococcus wardiae]|nr:hypothetical protein [Nitrosococcus wardiae]